MFRLKAKITIGNVTVDFADKLTIDRTWDSLVDTCSFTIPNKVRDQNGDFREIFGNKKYIDQGDEVKIDLGYYPDVETEFTGYVTHIHPGFPLKIECEDEGYLLKREYVNDKFKDVSLQDFLDQISPIPARANATVGLGTIRADNVTVADLMNELRDTYGLVAFIRDGELEVGVPYAGEGETFEYEWGRNMIQDDLVWQNEDEVQWKVRAVSPRPDGSKIETEVGDDGGSVRTFFKYDVDKATLKKAAQEFLDRVKFTGFRGTLTSFGLPRCRHGDTIDIKHRLTERNGKYKVKRVVTRFGSGGFRRVIHPERQAA